MTIKHLGTVDFGDEIIISDPCYKRKNTSLYVQDKCSPGTYYAYAVVNEVPMFGDRITSLYITKEKGEVLDEDSLEVELGIIGVDSGMAGLFSKKEDLNDEEWDIFINYCDWIKNQAWNLDQARIDKCKGVCSESGVGDGCYEVHTNDARDKFIIIFLWSDELTDENDNSEAVESDD